MKQLKFLKNVMLEGNPIWYRGCIYDVISVGASSGREMYKLYCEDLTVRGIDSNLENIFYTVIEIEDKKEKKIEEPMITEQVIESNEEKSEIQKTKKNYNNSKKSTRK